MKHKLDVQKELDKIMLSEWDDDNSYYHTQQKKQKILNAMLKLNQKSKFKSAVK